LAGKIGGRKGTFHDLVAVIVSRARHGENHQNEREKGQSFHVTIPKKCQNRFGVSTPKKGTPDDGDPVFGVRTTKRVDEEKRPERNEKSRRTKYFF
jgi:hypothetical protein